MKRRAVFATIVASIILIAGVWLAPRPTMYSKSMELMSTTITITAVSSKKPDMAEAIMDSVFSEIQWLEKTLSFWTTDSEIAKINRAAGKHPVKVSPETLEVALRALEISKATDGAFDPTVGPLMTLWDHKTAAIPDSTTIARTIPLVDYRKIIIDQNNSTIMLADSAMSFDTGGIAKGYAADKAVELLKSKGVKAGLVAVAGDIRAFGSRPDGRPWSIGIRDPRSDSPDKLIARISLSDMAISTSGDYERFFIKDGKRYHHIIDPKTGKPSIGTMSATVIAPLTVHTDGYSTAVFIQGQDMGIRTLESLGLQGIIIDDNGRTRTTQGLRGHIKWLTDTYKPGN